jgi:hypothetical protein
MVGGTAVLAACEQDNRKYTRGKQKECFCGWHDLEFFKVITGYAGKLLYW